MTSFYYRASQEEARALFGGLSAAEAAELILGRKQLSAEQADFINRCGEGAGQYRLVFEPAPTGHVGFYTAGSRGCGNRGVVFLRPATSACRRLVNSARRAEFVAEAAKVGLSAESADRVFSVLRGYVPALSAAIAILPAFEAGARSDRALRDAGFRPRHPVEGAAIAALRAIKGKGDWV